MLQILLADDKELNKWYPIGKLSKIQPEAVQKFEAKIYKRKANDIELKRKLLPSLFKEEYVNYLLIYKYFYNILILININNILIFVDISEMIH